MIKLLVLLITFLNFHICYAGDRYSKPQNYQKAIYGVVKKVNCNEVQNVYYHGGYEVLEETECIAMIEVNGFKKMYIRLNNKSKSLIIGQPIYFITVSNKHIVFFSKEDLKNYTRY